MDQNNGDRDGAIIAYMHGKPSMVEYEIDPFAISEIEVFEPPHISDRISAQQALFTVEPEEHNNEIGNLNCHAIKYWYVSHKKIGPIKSQLQRLGFSRATLFPGLDAIARDLASATYG